MTIPLWLINVMNQSALKVLVPALGWLLVDMLSKTWVQDKSCMVPVCVKLFIGPAFSIVMDRTSEF